MSGGVRNLRAMFEQNKDTSPPDRGRSPGESAGGASNGTSPRPLSKVRTQFVTVEKNGGLGLRRDTAGEPSIAKRRTSFSIDEEEHPLETAERKQSIAAEMDARKNSTLISETIPEMAIETPSIEEPHKTLDGAGSSVPVKEAPKADNLKVEEKKPTDMGRKTNGHTNGTTKPAAAKTVEKSVSKPVAKPAPISIAKTNVASKASPKKSPLPKTPTTPSSRSQSHAKVPEKKIEKKTEKKIEKVEKKVEKEPAKSSAPTQAKPASKPPTTTASSAPAKTRIPNSPPQTGFVKPRPRSPTRPVKLPASLTAHTASSGSKTAAAGPPPSRQTLSRASGNAQPTATNSLQAHHAMSRSPSRASASNAKSTSLARKPSTLKSSTSTRPSLGPPPKELKKQPSRQSLPAPADESFLARMMRPTTASASKTAEKLPTTPPKRSQSVKRPTTRDGSSKPTTSLGSPAAKVHKESPAKVISKDVKPVAKSPIKVEEQQKAELVSPSKVDNAVLKESPAKDVEIIEPAPEVQEVSPVEPVIAEVETKHVEELIPETVQEEPVAEELAVKEEAPAPVVEPTETTEDISAITAATETKEKAAPTVEEQEVTIPEPEPVKEEPIEAKPTEPEPIVHQEVTKPEIIEDPEDVKAREEIARLNAELMKAAEEEA